MRIPIHREGWRFAAVAGLAAGVVSLVSRRLGKLLWAFTAFVLYFFRDPEREIPQGRERVVSPADGTVVAIDRVDRCEFIDGPAKRVSVFLSIFDVHINRSPIAGEVKLLRHQPGKFLPANVEAAAIENEQNTIGIADGEYRVVVRQIAGIIARRIVCGVSVGEPLAKGDRLGLIRFGSRTDLYVPVSTEISVSVGDKVCGGVTIMGIRE